MTMKANREKVVLPDDPDGIQELMHGGGRYTGWEWVDESVDYVDLEKSHQTMQTILRREEDGKLFRFEYGRTPYHSIDEGERLGHDWPLVGEEVTPKTEKITVYK
jgi:hypothetical protein